MIWLCFRGVERASVSRDPSTSIPARGRALWALICRVSVPCTINAWPDALLNTSCVLTAGSRRKAYAYSSFHNLSRTIASMADHGPHAMSDDGEDFWVADDDGHRRLFDRSPAFRYPTYSLGNYGRASALIYAHPYSTAVLVRGCCITTSRDPSTSACLYASISYPVTSELRRDHRCARLPASPPPSAAQVCRERVTVRELQT